MMRPIDGDALRDKLRNLADDEWNQSTTTSWAEAFYACADIVAEAPTIEPEPHWIKCSERLPEEGHDVLITKESFKIKGYEQDVIKAKRSVDPRSGKIEWWSPEFGTLTNKAVLAWMPLPEPFKEDKGC